MTDDLFAEAHKQWDAGNTKEAFALFKEADQQGADYAANSIGYFFDLGIGVRKDKNKALAWYKKAARKHDILAYSNIGTIYRDRHNIRRAQYWFLKALDNGDDDAALELGKLYIGTNKHKARHYLRLAYKSNNCTQDSKEEAQNLLQAL